MKKFKCVLVRSQYQTVEVEAEDYTKAEELAREMFDGNSLLEGEYVEVYDMEEVPTKELK